MWFKINENLVSLHVKGDASVTERPIFYFVVLMKFGCTQLYKI